MLTGKGYLNNTIISRAEFLAQEYVGKQDGFSRMMRSVIGADENGETKHNYFSFDERLFRAITNVSPESKIVIDKIVHKHKLKWYQSYPQK